jgi:hypothetical protein
MDHANPITWSQFRLGKLDRRVLKPQSKKLTHFGTLLTRFLVAQNVQRVSTVFGRTGDASFACWSRQRTILLVTRCECHVSKLVCRACALAFSGPCARPKAYDELRNNPRGSDAKDQLSANRAIAHLFPGGRRDDRRADGSVADPLARATNCKGIESSKLRVYTSGS